MLGYSIVLLSHNWPLVLALGLSLWAGWQLYCRPERKQVCWFFGTLLFGLAYEYGKHVAPTLHSSLDTVLGAEAGWLSGPAHAVVGPGLKLLLFGAMAFFLGQALWLEARTQRQVERLPHSRAGRQS